MRLASRIAIRAPADLVFRVLSAPERLPEWNPSARSAARLGNGDIGLGSRAVMHGLLLGQTIESETEVVAFQPPVLFATRGIRGPRISTVFRLASVMDGTALEATVEGDLPGGRLGGFIAENMLRGDFERSLHQLKALCEAEASRLAAAEPVEADAACWLHERQPEAE